MFRLFQSFFSQQDRAGSGYPESLINEAIERAVAGTDARVRAVSGYQKRLRPAVIRAIDHVVAMVEQLPPAVPANVQGYREDSRLRAMFATPDRMFTLLGNDRELGLALRASARADAPLVALMLTEMNEKHVLGVDLEDDMLKRDVRQTVISFDAHRLVDPSADEASARRALRRRAFDAILAQVLERIGALKDRRQKLASQRELLRHKHELMKSAGWSFEGADPTAEKPDLNALEQKLAQVDAALEEAGVDAEVLDIHLRMLADALSAPEKELWIESRDLILDHTNILRDTVATNAPSMRLQVLRNARGARAAAVLVALEPQLLKRPDFFAAAKRYL